MPNTIELLANGNLAAQLEVAPEGRTSRYFALAIAFLMLSIVNFPSGPNPRI